MGKIVKVSGPLVVATGMEEANMADVVRVGEQRLIGEILTMTGGSAMGMLPPRSTRRLPAWALAPTWPPPAPLCPWSWAPA